MKKLKERILEGARKELKRKGFRFTISELATQLGISTKTFYEYYPSKNELIGDILNQAIKELKVKENEILLDLTIDTVEKLKKCLILIPVDFQFAQLGHLEELQRYYPMQWEILDSCIREQWESVLSLMNEGILLEQIRPFNTQIFIDLYIGGLYRLMDNSSSNKNNVTLLETMEELVDILMHGILKKDGS